MTYGGYVHHYCMVKASPILSGLAPVSLRLCSQCGQKWVEDRLKVRHTCVFAHLMVCAWEWTWAWVLGVVVVSCGFGEFAKMPWCFCMSVAKATSRSQLRVAHGSCPAKHWMARFTAKARHTADFWGWSLKRPPATLMQQNCGSTMVSLDTQFSEKLVRGALHHLLWCLRPRRRHASARNGEDNLAQSLLKRDAV